MSEDAGVTVTTIDEASCELCRKGLHAESQQLACAVWDTHSKTRQCINAKAEVFTTPRSCHIPKFIHYACCGAGSS